MEKLSIWQIVAGLAVGMIIMTALYQTGVIPLDVQGQIVDDDEEPEILVRYHIPEELIISTLDVDSDEIYNFSYNTAMCVAVVGASNNSVYDTNVKQFGDIDLITAISSDNRTDEQNDLIADFIENGSLSLNDEILEQSINAESGALLGFGVLLFNETANSVFAISLIDFSLDNITDLERTLIDESYENSLAIFADVGTYDIYIDGISLFANEFGWIDFHVAGIYSEFAINPVQLPDPIIIEIEVPVEVEVPIEIEVPVERTDNITILATIPDSLNIYETKTDNSEITDTQNGLDENSILSYDVNDNKTADIEITVSNVPETIDTIINDPNNCSWWDSTIRATSTTFIFTSFEIDQTSTLNSFNITAREVAGTLTNFSIFNSSLVSEQIRPDQQIYSISQTILSDISEVFTKNITVNYSLIPELTYNNTFFIKMVSNSSYRACFDNTTENSIDYTYTSGTFTLRSYDFCLNYSLSTLNNNFNILLNDETFQLNDGFLEINSFQLNDEILIVSFDSDIAIEFDLEITITLYSDEYLDINSSISLTQLIFQLTPENGSAINLAYLLTCTNEELVVFTDDPQILSSALIVLNDFAFRIDLDDTGLVVNQTYSIEIVEFNATIVSISGSDYVCSLSLRYAINDTEYLYTDEAWVCYAEYLA